MVELPKKHRESVDNPPIRIYSNSSLHVGADILILLLLHELFIFFHVQ